MPGVVTNPVAAKLGDGLMQANNVFGVQGEQLKADLHGKWYNAAVRKSVFMFNVTAVTVPVVGSGLVSVFTLYNPPSSGVLAEIIRTDIGTVVVPTVVNTFGWYFSTAALTAAGTFTTKAVALSTFFSGRVGDTPSAGVVPYTAYTHSGTPVRCDIVATLAGTTSPAMLQLFKNHEGTLILPPGIAMSFATSTAAETASALDLGVTWAEWPFI
jgi:hypothetical protein